MRNSPAESVIGAYFSFSALSVTTPSFLKNRFKVASPSIKAQTISPFSTVLCCFTITRSPSMMPAPIMLSPLTRVRKFSTAHVRGNDQNAFDVFFAQKGSAGGHPAQNRHFSSGGENRLAQSIEDFDGP